MKMYQYCKWHPPYSSCLSAISSCSIPAGTLFKASPRASRACRKSRMTTGRCHCCLPAPQRGCSAPAPPDPQGVRLCAPTAPQINSLCCRTYVSLTQIPPTAHQKGQWGMKGEFNKIFDTMLQDTSSFLASVKVSDTTAFLPVPNYFWLFLSYHSRTLKRENIFNSSLLTQTK